MDGEFSMHGKREVHRIQWKNSKERASFEVLSVHKMVS
jgi:hypothetical protein